MDKPSAVRKLGQGVVKELSVDHLLDLLQLLDALGPVGAEDLGSEFTPCGGCYFVVICGQHTELVE